MMNRVLACLVLAAALLPGATLAANCQTKMFADVEFDTASSGMAQVPVRINGQKRTFLLDTGAAVNAISASTANALGMTMRPAADPMELFGGLKLDREVVADTLSVGPVQTLNAPLIVAPSTAFPPSLDGLLGASLLHNYDVELDFANSRFRLFSPEHCGQSVVYWTSQPYTRVPIRLTSQSHITLPVLLDGKPILAVLDTGSETSAMSLEQARMLFNIVPNDRRLKARAPEAFNGLPETENFGFVFNALTLEGVTVDSPDILLLPSKNMGHDPPPLLLGVGLLRQLHLYIAYQEQALYVTGAEAR
jgi:predicted aspartyl protease